MIKIVLIISYSFLILIPFFNINTSQASDTINKNTYNKCISSADIGDSHRGDGLSGISYQKIDVLKAKDICIKALKKHPNDKKK
ncbi:hypothetical protein OAM56_05970 [Alphaproteobacteria bacterium]|nr:hypothetical protein [Alphaproteobacteria bacterium]